MPEASNLDPAKKPVEYADKEIFTKLWSQPRLVFRYITDYHHDKYTHILLVLASIGRGLDRASTKNMGDTMSLPTVLVMSIFVGGAFGWMTYYIYAALVSWMGKALNGVASTAMVLRILAYAMFPTILSLLVVILQIAFFGNRMFQSEVNLDDSSLFMQAFYYVALIIQVVFGIWTICFAVVGISEVQKFSIGKAILNLLLPGLLIVTIVFLFVLALD
ncbi:Yip1 family protein [Chryseolinea sp. H1M3-3]|uniref:Yip1 family protein n=1 Tax=Chryseolinea sp. H1M3-3 TaxID=3034144 RepID=UPI0023EC8927|nr:Yip1 family protein [Chryseolinea sp. H1M3-3]